jgi:hypothetical protein
MNPPLSLRAVRRTPDDVAVAVEPLPARRTLGVLVVLVTWPDDDGNVVSGGDGAGGRGRTWASAPCFLVTRSTSPRWHPCYPPAPRPLERTVAGLGSGSGGGGGGGGGSGLAWWW